MADYKYNNTNPLNSIRQNRIKLYTVRYILDYLPQLYYKKKRNQNSKNNKTDYKNKNSNILNMIGQNNLKRCIYKLDLNLFF